MNLSDTLRSFLRLSPRDIPREVLLAARMRIASLGNRVAEWLLDFRYTGRSLRARVRTSQAGTGSYDYMPTGISGLRDIEKHFIPAPSEVLVDIGCGKGRVIAWWLSRGYANRIIGIEQDEELARFARRAFSRYGNVTVIHGDALEILPSDGDVFFMFNPFDDHATWKLKKKLAALAKAKDNLLLIYYNPVHAEVFRSDPDWEVIDFPRPRLRSKRFPGSSPASQFTPNGHKQTAVQFL